MAFGPPQGNVSDVESKKGIRQRAVLQFRHIKPVREDLEAQAGQKRGIQARTLRKVDQRAPVKGLAPRLSIWGQRRPYGIQIPS